MSQQHTHGDYYANFEDLGSSFPTHWSTTGTPRPYQGSVVRMMTMSVASQGAPNALGSPVPDSRPHRHSAGTLGTLRPFLLNATCMMMPDTSRASPDVLGSDVLHPASRPVYEGGDDWQCTMVPEDESQGLFSYECGDKDAPITSGDGPVFSEVLRRETEHSEDHVKRLKLWAQKVATEFGLKASQFLELSMFIRLGKNLDTGDLHMCIWQLAIGYRLLNGQDEIMAHSVNTQNAVETASAGIKGGFQLSVDQVMQVLIIAKDLVVQAGRTNYKGLHYDVEERLKSCADVLGFQNVFGNLANECVLCTVIKRECSAARNKLHILLLDSTGKSRMTLEELTWTALSKYKRGGVGSGSKAEYQLHFTYLRSYGKAHQYIAGTAADDESGNESGEEGAGGEAGMDVSTSEPPVKRAKSGSGKAPPGRVKGGRDFWSAIDRAFAKDFERYGKDMKNDKWRGLFNEIVLSDQARYGKNSGSVLQALPSMYTEPATPATTSNPRMLPSTAVHHGMSRMGQPIGPTHSNSSDKSLASNNAKALLGDYF
ncbi:hypothetical protein EDC04DRAFT_2908015 [Pisolithus marmoratus]|nr:hypothetical protein EDC04DRAFT_2908015 [Pisolithus marmoratus]